MPGAVTPWSRSNGPCASNGGLAGFYGRFLRDAALAAPTPDHFLPLVYVLAQGGREDPVAYPVEGFDGGSVSMLGVRIG